MERFLFPHEEIREVQDAFIKDTDQVLKEKKHLIAHAPTGIGKTTIIGPCLAHALKANKTVFFLTPIHTQHKIAVETLKRIKDKYNLKFTAVDLIGKKWMCLQPGVETISSSDFIDYCKDMIEKKNCEFYSKVKKGIKTTVEAKVLLTELKNKNPLSVGEVYSLCKEKKVCPYEISCLLAKDADIIIGDYYHILNSSVRETLFKRIDIDIEDCIIVFDEGHNLPSKTRDLLSVNLSTYLLDGAIKEAESLGQKEAADMLYRIKEVLEKFAQTKTSIETTEALVEKEEFVKKIENIKDYNSIIEDIYVIGKLALEVKKRSFSNSIANFLERWVGKDEGFLRMLSKGFMKNGKSYIMISYKCLDPSLLLKPLADKCQMLSMSGTFTPTKMYQDLFGYDADLKEYDNPFPKENRLNLIIPKTTTKFTKRDPEMFKKIAIVCSKLTNAVPGNSVVFFPSYKLRDEINVFFQGLCEKTTFLEQQGLSKEEREKMLEKFKSYKEQGAVLLAASTGSFGEGIDLPGDDLKAVIVVGLPLSKPDLEMEEMIKYYDIRFKKGWDYAYIYPAILKTMQNAGRCIRSKTDKGVIVFLDERYMWQNYYKCFPRDWKIKVSDTPISLIEEFFKGKEQ